MIIFSEIIDIKHQHPLNKIKYVWGNLNFMQVFQVTAPVQIVETLILACVENMRGREEREYLNSSCNSCKVISVSISYRDLIKDQMFTHIEFN